VGQTPAIRVQHSFRFRPKFSVVRGELADTEQWLFFGTPTVAIRLEQLRERAEDEASSKRHNHAEETPTRVFRSKH
jgi:hypothetical protein